MFKQKFLKYTSSLSLAVILSDSIFSCEPLSLYIEGASECSGLHRFWSDSAQCNERVMFIRHNVTRGVFHSFLMHWLQTCWKWNQAFIKL